MRPSHDLVSFDGIKDPYVCTKRVYLTNADPILGFQKYNSEYSHKNTLRVCYISTAPNHSFDRLLRLAPWNCPNNLIDSRSFEDSSVGWTPYLLLGINEGCVADELDGLSNLQMGLEFPPLNNHLELGAFQAYTIGLDENRGESLNDIFCIGINLGWRNEI